MELTIITRQNEVELNVNEDLVAQLLPGGALECLESNNEAGPFHEECGADFDRGELEWQGVVDGVGFWELRVSHECVLSGAGQDWEESETHHGGSFELTTAQVRTFLSA